MKRLIAATIALTLLGSTAAFAHERHGRDRFDGYRYAHRDEHRDHDHAGAAVALGVAGLAALAIIASQPDSHASVGGYYSSGTPYYGGSGYYGGSSYYGRPGYYGGYSYGPRGYYYDGRGYYGDDDDD